MTTFGENPKASEENKGLLKSHPKTSVFLFVVLILAIVYWVLYCKLTPLREYSGLREQPVPLGASTGNN